MRTSPFELPSKRLLAAVLLASGLLASSLLAPQAAEAYNRRAMAAFEEGLAALEASRWEAARDAFHLALSIDADEGRTRISGVKYADYYPSLGLAEALIEIGDAAGAAKALETFDAIKKPGDEQAAKAATLRSRLSAPAKRPAEQPVPTPAPSHAEQAVAAKRALDAGDLAGARRLARQAPTDKLSQEVLGAVDALLAERLTSARRDQELGALSAAEQKLGAVLQADPENTAAKSLLEAVRADAKSARDLMGDARAALAARRFDAAEDLARQARGRDASLSEDSRGLEREVSAARRESAASKPPPTVSPGGGGQALLAAARAALDAGRLSEARTKAADAAARESALSAEAEAVRTEISRRAGEADEALRGSRAAVAEGRFADARSLLGRAESLDTGLSSDARAVARDADAAEAEAGKLLAKIEAHLESGATPAAKSVLDDFAQAFPAHPDLTGLRASVAGSGDVVAGLRAYFSGDLGTSIERLSALAGKDVVRVDVLTVLASAHASRGLLAGGSEGQGGSDLERARELFARALAASPGLELDPKWFSPRVRELFASAKGS